MDSITAMWRVPTVIQRTGAAYASTWIGAQNADDGPPFIQLGTLEQTAASGFAPYEAFWSDDTLGGQPQPLGDLQGGDVVAASMRRTAFGWQLVLRDETSGRTMRRAVPYDPGGIFSQGEWLQEDPPRSSVAERDEPYPQMGTVSFEDVKVNGTVPHLRLANGETLMATGSVFLVPTRFNHDAFRLLPAKGFARRYLGAAATYDRVVTAFNVEQLKWRSDDAATRVADLQHLIVAYRKFDKTLRQVRWPASARSAMRRLERVNAGEGVELERLARAGASRNEVARTFRRTDRPVATAADAARAAVGLPPE